MLVRSLLERIVEELLVLPEIPETDTEISRDEMGPPVPHTELCETLCPSSGNGSLSAQSDPLRERRPRLE